MFKIKHKKKTLNLVRDTLKSGSKTMSNSMKYATDIGCQISKNINLNNIKDSLQKNSFSSLIIAAGLGLTILGIFKFFKK